MTTRIPDTMIIQDFALQRIIGIADRRESVDPLPQEVRNDATLLHQAAKDGHVKLVSYLIEELYSDVNKRDNNKRTPAMYAAGNEETEMVELLFNHGADMKMKDNRGRNILHHAVQNASMKTVEYLCSATPADDAASLVNDKDDDGTTPLHLAAQIRESFSNELVSNLLQIAGIDINIKDLEGKTAVMYAVEVGRTEIVEILCQHKATISETDNTGWNILHYAMISQSLETVECLGRYGSTNDASLVCGKDNTGITPLHLAAYNYNGNTTIISSLLEIDGVDVNIEDNDGITAMMYAAQAGKTEVIVILNGRADVNKTDNNGWTVTHHAVIGGFLGTVKHLCRIECLDINHRDKDGNTALLLAMRERKFKVALHLVEMVDCSISNESGSTPLSLAFRENHKRLVWEMVNKLSVHNVDVNLSNEKGETILHMGVYENDKEFVRKICQNPNVQNVKDIDSVTPIDIAVDKEFYSMLWILVQNLQQDQIDVNKSYKGGNTLLHLAVQHGDFAAAEYICALPGVRCKENDNGFDPFQLVIREEFNFPLSFLMHLYKLPGTKVKFNENINRQLYKGKGLIHIAAELRDKEECKRLLEAFSNIDVNAKDSENRTALHIATSNSDIDTIMMLCRHSNSKININSQDGRGMTALHTAAANNNVDIAKVLCRYPYININAEFKDSNGKIATPLLTAIEENATGVAIFLLSIPTIDVDIKDHDGNNIFEIVCGLIEKSSTDESASIASAGFIKPSKRLTQALKALIYEVDLNSSQENTETDGTSQETRNETLPETLRLLLDFKAQGYQSILALLQDKITAMSSDDTQNLIKAVLNVIIVGLQKYADDDNLRYTFYKNFMCEPLVEIFVDIPDITNTLQGDHTATIKIMKLVYVSLQANADCQISEKEFLRKALKGKLRSKFKQTVKTLGQTINGKKCSDIQLLAKNIHDTYFKKEKGFFSDIKKFFKDWEKGMAECLRLHKCNEREFTTFVFPIPGALVHIFDFALDAKVGADSLNGFSQRLGVFMIVLVVFTLLHENSRSAVELYSAEKELLRVKLGRFELMENDWTENSSLNYSKTRYKQKLWQFFWPFKMKKGEKVKAVIFNILTIIMMRPVVDRLMVLTHSPTKVRTVIRQESKQKSLNQYFMITEQIPELLIQFYLFQIYFNNIIATGSEADNGHNTTLYNTTLYNTTFYNTTFYNATRIFLNNMTRLLGCDPKLQNFTYNYEYFSDQQNLIGIKTSAPFWLIMSMTIPFLKIPASTLSLEKAFRKLDPLTPKMSEGASCLLYLTYIMMIPSRLFLHAGLMHATPNHFINVGYILFFTSVWFVINQVVISKNSKKRELSWADKVRKWWLLFLFSFRDFWVISLRDCTAYMCRPSEVYYKSLRSYKRIMVISSFYFVEGIAGAVYIEHFFPCGRKSDVFKYQGWLWLIFYIVSATCLVLLSYILQPQLYHLIPKRFPTKCLIIFSFGLIMLILAPMVKFAIDGNTATKVALFSTLAMFLSVCALVYLGLTYFGEAKDKKKTVPCCSGEGSDSDSDSDSVTESDAGALGGEGEARQPLLDTADTSV